MKEIERLSWEALKNTCGIDDTRYSEWYTRPQSLKYFSGIVVSVIRSRGASLRGVPIAVIGASGITVGALAAVELGVDLIVVRGHNKGSHDSAPFSGRQPVDGYIFVDDFVDSGKTWSHVVRVLMRYPHRLSCFYRGRSSNAKPHCPEGVSWADVWNYMGDGHD